MPVWVSDFVLGSFGTGAVVGVPAHDVRDFQFVKFVNLQVSSPAEKIEVIRVIEATDGDRSDITATDQVYEDDGVIMNSDFLDGLSVAEAQQKVMDHMEAKGFGKRVTTYRLRDWLISRQRYWGTPIPVVYDPEGNPHPVKEEHLPWELPTDVDFKPTGESPLKSSKEFIERTEKLYGKGWRPEFDTMDTFVDSSWYYLRYVDSRNTEALAISEQLNKWLPVDLYMIGPEHIVLHLLYSRFFTKFLRDEGHLAFDEPFGKMRHQGMI
jgi:leucyl-tRNA synthetase